MTIIQRRDWRANVRMTALEHRLMAAGCPATLEQILATKSGRNGPLTEWVRAQLGNGVVLRTSQAEHIAQGDSLTETADATGVEIPGVLYTLTLLEEDESAIAEFHHAPVEQE